MHMSGVLSPLFCCAVLCVCIDVFLTLVAVLHEQQAGLELVASARHVSILHLIAQLGHLSHRHTARGEGGDRGGGGEFCFVFSKRGERTGHEVWSARGRGGGVGVGVSALCCVG